MDFSFFLMDLEWAISQILAEMWYRGDKLSSILLCWLVGTITELLVLQKQKVQLFPLPCKRYTSQFIVWPWHLKHVLHFCQCLGWMILYEKKTSFYKKIKFCRHMRNASRTYIMLNGMRNIQSHMQFKQTTKRPRYQLFW